jgi:hypothetical protein
MNMNYFILVPQQNMDTSFRSEDFTNYIQPSQPSFFTTGKILVAPNFSQT